MRVLVCMLCEGVLVICMLYEWEWSKGKGQGLGFTYVLAVWVHCCL